jgi:O-antigen/teichoic acid export membrane protein
LRKGAVGGIAQAVASVSNVLVAVVVARELGAAALGQFSFLFLIMTLFVAVQTSWVGDSLSVLIRSDEATRRGISSTQWLHALAALLLAPAVALGLSNVDLRIAILFGVLTAVWELEEFGRRALMARLEFGRQFVADSSYLVLSFGALIGIDLLRGIDLFLVLLAMLVGAVGSFAFEMLLLPPGERLHLPRWRSDGIAQVARFGIWRAAQGATGYLGQTGYRYAVVAFGSFALLGSLEAARLMIAPLFTLLAAMMNVLLPMFARNNERQDSRRMAVVAAALVGACVLYVAVLVAVFPDAKHLLIGSKIDVSHTALAAWFAMAVTAAIFTPFSVAWVARGASKVVFRARVVGTAAGVAVACSCCFVGVSLISPIGLAFGNLVSTVFLLRVAPKGAHPRRRWAFALVQAVRSGGAP